MEHGECLENNPVPPPPVVFLSFVSNLSANVDNSRKQRL